MPRHLAIVITLGALAATVATAPASGADATLWACHGPSGQPLGAGALEGAATGDGAFGSTGGGCSGSAAGDGLQLRLDSFAGTIGAGSSASYALAVPTGVTPASVSVPWAVKGFGPGSDPATALRADVLAGSTTLTEVRSDGAAGPDVPGPDGAPFTGGPVTVRLDCAAAGSCASPLGGTPAVNVPAIALKVSDDAAPTGEAYLASEPVRDRVLRVRINADDDGIGLGTATALVDGLVVGQADLRGGCADLEPGGTLDLPVGALCPRNVVAAPIDVDLTGQTSGDHTVQVSVTDAAGNARTLLTKTFSIVDPRTGPQQTTATLLVGTGLPATPTVSGTGATAATDTDFARRVSCRAARLSVVLITKPVAVQGMTVVVKRHGRTFFRGRLTCLVGGRRVSGPRGSGIEILSTFAPQRILQRTGPSLRRGGRFAWTLTRTTSRLLTFRVRPIDGPQVRVSFRLKSVSRAEAKRLQAKAARASAGGAR